MAFSLDNIGKASVFTGIEIIQTMDGYLFHYAILKKEKDSIKSDENGTNLISFDALIAKIPKEFPLALSINTKGIIHREFNGIADLDDGSLMKRMLPDANARDFIIQGIPTEKGIMASLSRKKLSDDWISKFDKEGFWVLGIGLGPYTIHSVKPFIRENHFATCSHSLTYGETGKLVGFEKGSERPSSQILLGNERIASHLLPAVSVAFEGLLGTSKLKNYATLEKNKEEHRNKWLFNTLGVMGLTTVLLLLLASFLYGSHLKDENRNLGSQLSLKEAQFSEIQELKSKLSQYGNGGGTQPSMTSFYADRLAVTIPETIKLEWMEIYPMKGEEKDYQKGDLLNYTDNEIHIKGITNNSVNYNQWLGELRKEDWVKDAEHINYEDTTDGVGAFEIKITIK